MLNLQSQIDKLKKDSDKEMENNERLTSLQSRINDEIKFIRKSFNTDKEKYINLESDYIKFSKLVEQNEKEFLFVTTVSIMKKKGRNLIVILCYYLCL